MPIREFKCTNCNHVWEEIRKINEDDPTSCSECETEGKIIRMLSAASFKFKGGGVHKAEAVPEFNVEFNPLGKNHDEQFKVTERTPASVKEIHEKNIENTLKTAEKFKVEKITKGTIAGEPPPKTPKQLF